jgi:diguanylate cyclase (GGDEF)-like protein
MQLLLVEDDPDVAESTMAALRGLDAECFVARAATLREATELVQGRGFDAALVDLELPDASDCDVAHALRRQAPYLPVVALTGCEFESVAMPLTRAGVQDYLKKGTESTRRIHQTLLLAIERERQNAELRKRACYDDLTGAMNRAEFEHHLEKAVSQSMRNRNVGALILIDIDDFKAINDTFGHQAGDSVLQETAGRITDVIRAGDSIGRFGGDEFVALIEGLAETRDAEVVARKLRDATCRPVLAGNERISVSTSVGLSVFPLDGTSNAELIHLADRAMYASKRASKATGQRG